jgi:hypothetical protein
MARDISVGIATLYKLDDLEFESCWDKVFPFTALVHTSLEAHPTSSTTGTVTLSWW